MKKIRTFLKKIKTFFTKYFKDYYVFEQNIDPIIIEYKNNSDEEKKGYIFGFNHFGQNNYGNSETIIIKTQNAPNLDNIKDGLILGKIRIKKKTVEELSKTTLSYNQIDSNGKSVKISHVLLNSIDIYQSSQNIVDVERFTRLVVDGNTFFEFNLFPHDEVSFSIYTLKTRRVSYYQLKKINESINKNGTVIIQYEKPSIKLLISYYFRLLKNIFKKDKNQFTHPFIK